MLSKTEFQQVFEAHFDAIRGFIFYRCGDADVASDIAQDVFMKIWEKRSRLDATYLKPLLYKMASEMVISNYRKENTRQDFARSIGWEQPTSLSPEEEILYKEYAAMYAQALEQMPETQRVVFLMSRNDGLTYPEIAGLLTISVKAVEKRMSAALQRLKVKLT